MMEPCAEMFRSSMSHWLLLGFLKKHSVNRKSNVGDNPEKEEADDFQNTHDHREYERDEDKDNDNSHDDFYLRVNDYVCKLLVL
jgi:hypothetical protein